MALYIHLLSCAFGLGSWMAVNGMWVELPLIVNTLPEGWNLPSYLTVIIQMANVGPLLVTLMHKLYPGRLKERYVNCVILSIGIMSCILLAIFWDWTTVVAGAPRSTAFFIITFFLALVDCTSSVTFLPFMMQLPAKYVTTYFIGEGLSGFSAGVVALVQGVGIAKCVNSTQTGNHTNNGNLQTEYLPTNFSVEVFFSVLAVMLCISLGSFIALVKLPEIYELSRENLTPATTETYKSYGLDNLGAEINKEDMKCQGEGTDKRRTLQISPEHSVYQLTFMYFLMLWVNCAFNGLLPSVQSYSCIPYGNRAYHLSAVLASVANPVACIIAIFYQQRSLVFLGALTLIGTGFGSYNMAMAAMSPCPLLQGSLAGEIVIVLSWISFSGTMVYVNVMVSVILRDRSHSALVWCGAATQLGSLLGSVTMFPLVNIYKLFQSADYCNTKCPL